MLAGAGKETTGRLIGWLAKVLAEHPDQRRAALEDRSLLPNVTDETLRFEPTGHATARYVMEDVEYHVTTVPAGSLNRFPEWDVDLENSALAPTSTVRGWERLPLVIR